MSDWSQDSEDLFRDARRAQTAGGSPSKADRERVRARIASKLAGVAAGAAVATATTKSAAGVGASAGAGVGAGAAATATATKGATFALVAKIMTPIVIAGVGLAAAPRVVARVNASRATTVDAPRSADNAADRRAATSPATPHATAAAQEAPAVAVDALPAAVDAPSLPPAPSAPRAASIAARGPSQGAPSSAPTAAMSSEEALLVGEIDTALRTGDAGGALRLASEHERRFPRGALAQEREGARVVARCMNGAKSSSGAAAFLAMHPRSPMRARIVAACETVEPR